MPGQIKTALITFTEKIFIPVSSCFGLGNSTWFLN